MPRAAHPAKEFDYLCIPACNVKCQFLKQCQCSLAAAIVDRLCHIQPLRPRIEIRHEVGRQQVSNIRNYPVIAGFDRLIFPGSVYAPPQNGSLCANAINEFAQGPITGKLVAVQRMVDCGQEIPELVRVIDVVMIRIERH